MKPAFRFLLLCMAVVLCLSSCSQDRTGAFNKAVDLFASGDYAEAAKERGGKPMLLHKFHQGKHYQGPDGKIYWLPIIEVFDLRGFEWQDGKYVGHMVEIDPNSEYAAQMVEVNV